MSYSRRFNRQVAVPYRGSITISYPASESGGSKTVSYSGTAYEEVEVDIKVDTSSFDASVDNCNRHVNGLTASVGAMNTAQCIAIGENAEKVSKSIIDGFFHTVRTDLSTQKAELEQVIEARLLLLRQQAESLKERQQALADDYARITGRYQKIFNDLNNELSVRIHEVDQPIFNVVKGVDKQSDRMLHTDMVQTAITISKESNILRSQICVATVKNHALEAMEKAQNFLTSKAVSERAIRNTTIEGNGDDKYLVPVCYMRTESEKQHVEQNCLVPDYYSNRGNLKEKLCETLDSYDFPEQTEFENDQLKSYVQDEIIRGISGDDNHSNRVRALINKMLNK